jgi:hypothetical protein
VCDTVKGGLTGYRCHPESLAVVRVISSFLAFLGLRPSGAVMTWEDRSLGGIRGLVVRGSALCLILVVLAFLAFIELPGNISVYYGSLAALALNRA